MQRLLCLECGEEIAISEDVGLSACPKCGGTGTPADLDKTLTVRITDHELRILTMWASNYAGMIEQKHPGSERVVQTILDRLGTQTDVPLTLAQEIADVRAAFPDADVKVYRSDNTEMEL